MQKSKAEMVWRCEKQGGELRRKEDVKHRSTFNERKRAPEATLDGHHQLRHVCAREEDTQERDIS